MVKLPVQRTSDGFIDEEEIFKLAYGRLELPYGTLDDISFVELRWLLESKVDVKKEMYETFVHVVQVGYVRAKTGKDIKLFNKKNDQSKVGTITKEKKKKDMDYLDNIFGGTK